MSKEYREAVEEFRRIKERVEELELELDGFYKLYNKKNFFKYLRFD